MNVYLTSSHLTQLVCQMSHLLLFDVTQSADAVHETVDHDDCCPKIRKGTFVSVCVVFCRWLILVTVATNLADQESAGISNRWGKIVW